jgi:hypothetical protein
MLTRRELLLLSGAFGLPMTVALSAPAARNGRLRLGVLQSRAPFIDERDLRGSRERAFDAYRALLRRSAQQNGSLDWLAGGMFVLSGPGPFPAPTLEYLALTAHSAEVDWLASFAQDHGLRVTIGTWWREPGADVAPRLLVFEPDGVWWPHSTRSIQAFDRVNLQMPATRGASNADLAVLCRRQRSYGVRIATLIGPSSPPGARAPAFDGSTIIDANGVSVAFADPHVETCLVAAIPCAIGQRDFVGDEQHAV